MSGPAEGRCLQHRRIRPKSTSHLKGNTLLPGNAGLRSFSKRCILSRNGTFPPGDSAVFAERGSLRALCVGCTFISAKLRFLRFGTGAAWFKPRSRFRRVPNDRVSDPKLTAKFFAVSHVDETNRAAVFQKKKN